MKNSKGETLTVQNLPAHWLEDYHARIQAGMTSDLNVAADQLLQVIKQEWLKAKDNDETWGNEGKLVLMFSEYREKPTIERLNLTTSHSFFIDRFYRLLDENDYPPEMNNKEELAQ